MNRFRQLLLYLGFPTARATNMPVGHFCRVMCEFALEYRTTREKILEQLAKKANIRERKKTRGKLIVDNASDASEDDSDLSSIAYIRSASIDHENLDMLAGLAPTAEFVSRPPLRSFGKRMSLGGVPSQVKKSLETRKIGPSSLSSLDLSSLSSAQMPGLRNGSSGTLKAETAEDQELKKALLSDSTTGFGTLQRRKMHGSTSRLRSVPRGTSPAVNGVDQIDGSTECLDKDQDVLLDACLASGMGGARRPQLRERRRVRDPSRKSSECTEKLP
ncbi:formin y 2 domain containing 1 [Cichlidogyrus casuarinus]|uniref:Formin y 2 domain containing 1 n=1 Tax=Cichlidogyrus casuarinus TaxID=1844966 RepID=A0ABD2Q579_9PLAT